MLIGGRICVHAIPASDAMEYEGMPAFAETGVLEMDPMIEEAVESHLGKKEDIVFNVEHMSPSLSFKLEELEEKEQMPKLKLPATFRIRFEDGNLSLIR